jgi:hypothetical protein
MARLEYAFHAQHRPLWIVRRPVTEPAKTRVSVTMLSTACPPALMFANVLEGLNGIRITSPFR